MQEFLETFDDIECRICSIDEDIELGYDLHIIGCPIYFERPMKSMPRFVEENLGQFQQKPLAVFILGWAKRVYSRMEGHIKKSYFGPLLNGLEDNLLSQHMFKGWVRKIDPEQQQEAVEWIEEVITLFKETTTT